MGHVRKCPSCRQQSRLSVLPYVHTRRSGPCRRLRRWGNILADSLQLLAWHWLLPTEAQVHWWENWNTRRLQLKQGKSAQGGLWKVWPNHHRKWLSHWRRNQWMAQEKVHHSSSELRAFQVQIIWWISNRKRIEADLLWSRQLDPQRNCSVSSSHRDPELRHYRCPTWSDHRDWTRIHKY